ncbi:MAG TPA: hypothetical protein PLH72_11160 [Vicinamibacterales bacterium]|nr:hypothetical protein [Vicinamibacterales bacterium]
MNHSRALKLLLKRGALVTAANWPVVVVQFVADTLFDALLAVPVAGGVVLVMLLVGAEPGALLRMEYRQVLPALIGALVAQPFALAAFLGALALVAGGGSVLMFAVKAGTLTVLVAGERAAGAIELPPLHLATLAGANQFSIDRFTRGMGHLFRRFLSLGAVLACAYALAVGAYAVLVFGPPMVSHLGGTLLVTMASMWLIGLITIINFVYLLTQIVMAADDCGVAKAVSRVARLIVREARPIVGVLGAILGLMVLATAASVLATAALGLIAFVPFVGLAALPLQLAAWLLRGLVFQYISLAGAAAYVRLHERTRVAEAGERLAPAGWDGATAR